MSVDNCSYLDTNIYKIVIIPSSHFGYCTMCHTSRL